MVQGVYREPKRETFLFIHITNTINLGISSLKIMQILIKKRYSDTWSRPWTKFINIK